MIPLSVLERGKSANRELLSEETVREHPAGLDKFSPGPKHLHPRLLKGLTGVSVAPLRNLRSWKIGKIPQDWRRDKYCSSIQQRKILESASSRPLNFRSW